MTKVFINPGNRIIPLTKGRTATVSAEDYAFLSKSSWYYSKRGYACARINKKLVPMHRIIMERKLGREILPKEQCDHINHNKLDNTRENLRLVSNQQNCFNTGKFKRKCSSKYKGVCLSTQKYVSKNGDTHEYKKWIAYIKKDGKRIHIGCFKTEKAAADAYNTMAAFLFGEYAFLNNVA